MHSVIAVTAILKCSIGRSSSIVFLRIVFDISATLDFQTRRTRRSMHGSVVGRTCRFHNRKQRVFIVGCLERFDASTGNCRMAGVSSITNFIFCMFFAVLAAIHQRGTRCFIVQIVMIVGGCFHRKQRGSRIRFVHVFALRAHLV